jgi:hypothetical protein
VVLGSCWELCCAQNYPELYPRTELLFTCLRYTSLDIYWGDVYNASCTEYGHVIPKTLLSVNLAGFFWGGGDTAREVSTWKLAFLCVDSDKRCTGVAERVSRGDTNLFCIFFCNAGVFCPLYCRLMQSPCCVSVPHCVLNPLAQEQDI